MSIKEEDGTTPIQIAASHGKIQYLSTCFQAFRDGILLPTGETMKVGYCRRADRKNDTDQAILRATKIEKYIL